jgi:hypothetical protein
LGAGCQWTADICTKLVLISETNIPTIFGLINKLPVERRLDDLFWRHSKLRPSFHAANVLISLNSTDRPVGAIRRPSLRKLSILASGIWLWFPCS